MATTRTRQSVRLHDPFDARMGACGAQHRPYQALGKLWWHGPYKRREAYMILGDILGAPGYKEISSLSDTECEQALRWLLVLGLA